MNTVYADEEVIPTQSNRIIAPLPTDKYIEDVYVFSTPYTFVVNEKEHIIINGKQYLSKTIPLRMSELLHETEIFELSGIKFNFYAGLDYKQPQIPGLSALGFPYTFTFEYSDGVTEKGIIKTTQGNIGYYSDYIYGLELYSRYDWPQIGVLTSVTQNDNFTKLLIFEKNSSPYAQLQLESDSISCKVGLELHFKLNGNPMCVKESTFEKLMERGWGFKIF